MIRPLHRWPGLLAALLLLVLAASGAALSVFPAAERLTALPAAPGESVAELVSRVQAVYPGVEQIRRSPTGKITVYWFENGTPGAAVVDPATGQAAASADPSRVERWLTNLHRSLFLGDAGRVVTAAGAAAMLVLSLSGAMLVARRAGGWRKWFVPLRGSLPARLHVEIARIAVLGLIISSSTALWMTASTFDLLPDAEQRPPVGAAPSGTSGADVASIAFLAGTPVKELRELSLPFPGDPTDVVTLKTERGTARIDQGTGALLSWRVPTSWERVSETIYILHTGQGAAALGLVLGVMAAGVPVLAGTGVALWIAGRRGRFGIRGNAAAGSAETILLIGSEGGSTWDFAATLHAALSQAGQSVHAGPMSGFDPAKYRRARRLIVLCATHGDGDAPASASGFLRRLTSMKNPPRVPLAVLGFGDRSFPDFCGHARRIAEAAGAKGWDMLLPFDTVDRQSPQDFARWARDLGAAIGVALELDHRPVAPPSHLLTLVSRRDYGAEVQASTAILRFAVPMPSLWRRLAGRGFGRFAAGDLLGILPAGSTVPRFYSLASGHRDGFVEIVVRKRPGGLCSGQLTGLEPGDRVEAFLRRNPGFHAGGGGAPLILIGAGTGIGPLAGFVRANTRRRPIHLFFGMRHADCDFLYQEEMASWQREGRLRQLVTAVSRGQKPNYVQDALRKEAAVIARLVREGARVMVCGGRDMAAAVSATLAEILQPAGQTPATLKAEWRYAEDVY